MRRFEKVLAAAVFLAAAPAVAFAGAAGHEKPAAGHEKPHGHMEAHGGLAEPIFTKKSFPENEIEVEVAFDHKDKEQELELGVGGSVVVGERFQFGVEFPFVFRYPNQGTDVRGIGDVEFNLKYLVYRAPKDRFIFALDADVAPPTGNEAKETGQKGEWGCSRRRAPPFPSAGACRPSASTFRPATSSRSGPPRSRTRKPRNSASTTSTRRRSSIAWR